MKLRGRAGLQTRHASQTLASSSHHFILKILFHSISHSEISFSSYTEYRMFPARLLAPDLIAEILIEQNIYLGVCLLNPLFTNSLSTGDRVLHQVLQNTGYATFQSRCFPLHQTRCVLAWRCVCTCCGSKKYKVCPRDNNFIPQSAAHSDNITTVCCPLQKSAKIVLLTRRWWRPLRSCFCPWHLCVCCIISVGTSYFRHVLC